MNKGKLRAAVSKLNSDIYSCSDNNSNYLNRIASSSRKSPELQLNPHAEIDEFLEVAEAPISDEEEITPNEKSK